MNCSDLAQDWSRWWALVDAVMKFRFPYNREIRSLAEDLLASQQGFCSMELIKKHCSIYTDTD
jgi:hypothetical protein